MAIIYNRDVHDDSNKHWATHDVFAVGTCYRAVPLHTPGQQLKDQLWRFEGVSCVVTAKDENHALAQFLAIKPDFVRLKLKIPTDYQRVLLVLRLKNLHRLRLLPTNETYKQEIGGQEVEILDANLD
jgi:hypothetical protein